MPAAARPSTSRCSCTCGPLATRDAAERPHGAARGLPRGDGAPAGLLTQPCSLGGRLVRPKPAVACNAAGASPLVEERELVPPARRGARGARCRPPGGRQQVLQPATAAGHRAGERCAGSPNPTGSGVLTAGTPGAARLHPHRLARHPRGAEPESAVQSGKPQVARERQWVGHRASRRVRTGTEVAVSRGRRRGARCARPGPGPRRPGSSRRRGTGLVEQTSTPRVEAERLPDAVRDRRRVAGRLERSPPRPGDGVGMAAQQAAEVGTGRRRAERRPHGFRRHGAGLVVGGVVASSYDENVCTRTNAGTSATRMRTGATRSVSGMPSAQAPATGGAVGSAASVVTSRST